MPLPLRQQTLVQLMRAASLLEQQLDAVCGAYGLTHDQYNVLRILRGAQPAGHPRYAIAEKLISRAPDVTRLVGRLVREGLVERYRSPEDQRLSMSRITPRGMEVLAKLDPRVEDVHLHAAAELSETEAEMLALLCSRLHPED